MFIFKWSFRCRCCLSSLFSRVCGDVSSLPREANFFPNVARKLTASWDSWLNNTFLARAGSLRGGDGNEIDNAISKYKLELIESVSRSNQTIELIVLCKLPGTDKKFRKKRKLKLFFNFLFFSK